MLADGAGVGVSVRRDALNGKRSRDYFQFCHMCTNGAYLPEACNIEQRKCLDVKLDFYSPDCSSISYPVPSHVYIFLCLDLYVSDSQAGKEHVIFWKVKSSKGKYNRRFTLPEARGKNEKYRRGVVEAG
jgi:hypothetical protein